MIRVRSTKNEIQFFFWVAILLFCLPGLGFGASISVSGEVKKPLSLSMEELRKMTPFHINNVTLLEEKKQANDPEKLISVASYKGVLLRDLLERVGMKYTRKFEPGVYIRVRGTDGKENVFSFGEIFYSSIGRSVLLAYERNEKPADPCGNNAELIVSTDIRAGRRIVNVKEILVKRVEVRLKAYEDHKKKILPPPSSRISFSDRTKNKPQEITLEDLQKLPSVYVHDAVMIGDCEGFKGVYSFEGPTLRTVLEKLGVTASEQNYNRFVLISSDDGFCATFSLSEIFNSRLSDNIIIPYKKNGSLLKEDGFARSVAREDSTGGRSVQRIDQIEII
jgi:DMSO/TMAO reductase YedYZ molybdopterin-dependent catalytic subunit